MHPPAQCCAASTLSSSVNRPPINNQLSFILSSSQGPPRGINVRSTPQIYNQLLFAKTPMNILSCEEMKQAEIFLAKVPLNPKFMLKLPSQKQLQNISTFQSSIFPTASQSARKQLRKTITLTDNMRGLFLTQPNSVFQMVTFTLISILYQDQYSPSNDIDGNHYILQTIKCSLYSNDMEFKQIRNVDFVYETNQLKMLVYHFLSFMEQQSRTIKSNRIKCAQWIFQENPMLLAAFTLFLRSLLTKLGVDSAQDYKKCVSYDLVIMNLVEYFDLNYRNLGTLILFYEDGIFLSILANQVIVGEYYQNERQKENHKQQLQIKASVKMNMVESVVMSVEQKTSRVVGKKKGIVASDVKLFNFMLQSSSSDGNQRSCAQKQRELQLQTPHFKESGAENFQFLKKKRSGEFKPQQVKSQFQKLLINEVNQQKDFQAIQPTSQALYLQSQNQIGFNPGYISQKSIQTQQLDSPINQLIKIDSLKIIPVKQPAKNYVSHSNFRKTIEEKQKYMNLFKHNSQKQMNGSFYSGETHCFSSQSNNKEISSNVWTEITNCSCRKTRQNRNFIMPKVVDIYFAPQNKQKNMNHLASFTSPKFANNHKFNLEKAFLQQNFSKNCTKQIKKQELIPNLTKKPSFLNNLKKNKLQNDASKEISKASLNGRKNCDQAIARQKSQKYLKHLRMNQFHSFGQLNDIWKSQSKSAPKPYQNKTIKNKSDLGDHQNLMDPSHSRISPKLWQMASSFIQKVPQYSQINKTKVSQMSTPNIRQTSINLFAQAGRVATPLVSANVKFMKSIDQNGRFLANPEVKVSNLNNKEIRSQKIITQEIAQIKSKNYALHKNTQIFQRTWQA